MIDIRRFYIIFTGVMLIAAVASIPFTGTPSLSQRLFWGWLLLSAAIVGVRIPWLSLAMRFYHGLFQPIPRAAWLSRVRSVPYGVELAVLAVIALLAGAHLINFSTALKMDGKELSYLLNSGGVAAYVLRQTGSIPLWNPFIGVGEPLLENPFSYVLNPLMFLPIWAFGVINGAKVAVLLHLVLMAWGGWLLGLALEMRVPGRMLLALLLAGSGSLTGAVGTGFFQIGLSQVYVPFVYAGLFGCLAVNPSPPDPLSHTGGERGRRARIWVGIFAVFGALMIFAGTFFYVLTTAIGCIVIVIFHLPKMIRREARRLTLNLPMIRRVGFAALLLCGISAIRLLPQAVNAGYVLHPAEHFQGPYLPLLVLGSLYFMAWTAGMMEVEFHYHYIVWLPLWITVGVGRALMIFHRLQARFLRESGNVDETPTKLDNVVPTSESLGGIRWRILLPALLLILLFTAWGEAFPTAPMRRIYELIPFLSNWRFLTRILAAGAVWVALLTALGFDLLVVAGWRAAVRDGLRARFYRLFTGGALALIVGIGMVGAVDVLRNWSVRVRLDNFSTGMMPAVDAVRATHPGEFLSFRTNTFHDYWGIYSALVRFHFGNPDYHPKPLETTLGSRELIWTTLPAYAVGDPSGRFFEGMGYHAIRRAPRQSTTWALDSPLPYAFTIRAADLDAGESALRSDQVTAVAPLALTHEIETVRVDLREDIPPGSVLVVQETAYPGWLVMLNGEPAALESVGGFLGVRLPDGFGGQVVFHYEPPLLALGGVITVISAAALALYLLHFIPRRGIHSHRRHLAGGLRASSIGQTIVR